MSYQAIKFEKSDHVLVGTIQGPVKGRESLIFLSNELSDLSGQLAWDEEVNVIVLTGSGERSFVIGTIPPEINSESGEEVFSFLASSISKIDQPVIAAINGDAMGQGLELALACDLRFASETAHFGLPQIKEGLIPGDGGTQRLPRLAGKGRALELVLLGETINAAEAFRIGLVHKIIPSDQLMPAVMKIAKEMASKGAIAMRFAKEAIHEGMDMTLNQGLRLEADLYSLIHTTKDRPEGIHAFKEKRPPKFEGK